MLLFLLVWLIKLTKMLQAQPQQPTTLLNHPHNMDQDQVQVDKHSYQVHMVLDQTTNILQVDPLKLVHILAVDMLNH